MYLLLLLLLGLLTSSHPKAFAYSLAERQLGITDVPPCGLSCLVSSLSHSSCDLIDIACQCKDEELSYITATCMLANCTMADSLGSAKVQARLCNLSNDSRTGQITLVSNIVFSVVVLCVGLRISSKIITKRFSSDDYLIIAAFVFGSIAYGGSQAMTHHGFGKHLWSLRDGQLKAALRSFYISWNAYVITLGLVKMSLVAFYLQIFQSRGFRITCFILLGYIAISTIIMQFLTIFTCLPVQSFWDRDVKGQCLNVNAIGYANSANAILQDVVILFLPMPSLRGLHMKRWRKITVGLMLGVGAFGCITTIIRLHALLSFKIVLDPTWDYSNVAIWTALELASGIICASLPSIRLLLITMLRKSRSTLTTSRSRSRSANTPLDGPHSGPNNRERKGFALLYIPTVSEQDEKTFGSELTSINREWNTCSSDQVAQGNTPSHAGSIQPARHSSQPFLPPRNERSSRSLLTSFWSSMERASTHLHTDTYLDEHKPMDGFGNMPSEARIDDGRHSAHMEGALNPLPRAPEPCQYDRNKGFGRERITALPAIEGNTERSGWR